VWLRETPSVFGFYFVLTLHTIGLSLVVGPNAAIDLRILGVGRQIPLAPLKPFFGLMWTGLIVNVASGVLLVVAYPTKAFTNPVFYLKLTLIGLAVWALRALKKRVFDDSTLSEPAMLARGKTLAVCSLVLWAGVITTGRVLAYTCSYLLNGVPC
jgi:hypothetical protein